MTKKACPDCVIDVGAASVELRHHLDDAEPMFKRLLDAIETSRPHMQAEGMFQAEYGPALEKIHEARAAYGKILSAHLHLAGAMDRIGIATPSKMEIGRKRVKWLQQRRIEQKLTPLTDAEMETLAAILGNWR